MKIRLGLLDRDAVYLNRLSTTFSAKYADKVEVYAFTDANTAMEMATAAEIAVFLADPGFEIDPGQLPEKCGFAYLVPSAGVDAVNGNRAICKYQKVDIIYKQILDLFSDNSSAFSVHQEGNEQCQLLIFASPCGGTGTSTMAAACAIHLARKGKRVLYLNLEKLGASDVFFRGDGQGNFGDIIYAMKSRKANLALKIESCVRCDAHGVHFYAPAKIALDMLELTGEETQELFRILKSSAAYDFIIVDMDFQIRQDTIDLLRQGDALVWVGDGSELSNSKIVRAYDSLAALEQSGACPLLSRIRLIYNRFSNKTGKTISDVPLNSIGGTHRMEHATSMQILEQLATLTLFDQIL